LLAAFDSADFASAGLAFACGLAVCALASGDFGAGAGAGSCGALGAAVAVVVRAG
jgi:hypothetical protein